MRTMKSNITQKIQKIKNSTISEKKFSVAVPKLPIKPII
jgi:hypothetical protein